MKAIIGKKIKMTQVYDSNDIMTPVTIIKVDSCVLLYKKEFNNKFKIKLGYGLKKKKNSSKALIGSIKNSFNTDKYVPFVIKEFCVSKDINNMTYELGSKINVNIFDVGNYVNVTGNTKGRGFQGVVKRYGFSEIRATHGSGYSRKPGSSGCRTFPGNVVKGKKFPGHMGNVKCTVNNLKIEKIKLDENILYLKGCVPGSNNGIVFISLSNKK